MPKRAYFFPRNGGDKAWLYLFERQNGVVKIGFTRRPHHRFQQHRTECKRLSTPLVRFHLFGAVHRMEIIQAEKDAVAALARIGERIEQTEQFRGLTFADAVRAVREDVLTTKAV